MFVYVYIRTYVHAYMRTCVHAYMRTCVHAYTRTRVHAYTRTRVHAYMRTCVHTYLRTYVHTYIYIMHCIKKVQTGKMWGYHLCGRRTVSLLSCTPLWRQVVDLTSLGCVVAGRLYTMLSSRYDRSTTV